LVGWLREDKANFQNHFQPLASTSSLSWTNCVSWAKVCISMLHFQQSWPFDTMNPFSRQETEAKKSPSNWWEVEPMWAMCHYAPS
jgi:hypothetical protein